MTEQKRNQGAGGAGTNGNGLPFEGKESILNLFADYTQHKYYVTIPQKKSDKKKLISTVIELTKNNEKFTHITKGGINSWFLEEHGIIVSKTGAGKKAKSDGILSKGLEPDEAIFNHNSKTLHVFEKKYQNGAGSVDEKLQTCDFKKKQYEKLGNIIGAQITYSFILSSFFEKNKELYADVFNYIESVECSYYFGVPKDYFTK